ncbi:MAG: SRPBCC family protein [Deltaproteobacteria bacterium]
MPIFETSVALECPRERAFEFLLRPANVALISPPELGLSFINAPEVVELGSRIEFKIQGYGQVQTMVHEITGLVHPQRITETQIRGLFAKWVHEHAFETNEQGQVIVIDRIDFKPPAGLLGLLVTADKILDQLEEGFAHRHTRLQKLLTA